MTQAYLFLLIAQLAIGAAAIFARLALEGANPWVVSALRLSIAAVPVLVMAGRRSSFPLQIQWKYECALGLAGVALAIHFAAWIESLLYISVAVSTLLVCSTPLWSSLYETLGCGRKSHPLFWLGLFTAAGGLALIVNDASDQLAPVSGSSQKGVFLALLGSVAIGVYLAVVEWVSSASQGYTTVLIVSRTYSWAAACLIFLCLMTGQQLPKFSDHRAWLGIAGLGFISQLIGHTLLNSALQCFSPSIIAFVTLVEPVFAALLAALIFSEPLTGPVLGGGVIVLSSVALVLRVAPSKRK